MSFTSRTCGRGPPSAQDRDGRGVDHDPLELVQRRAGVVRERDPGDVAVGGRRPRGRCDAAARSARSPPTTRACASTNASPPPGRRRRSASCCTVAPRPEPPQLREACVPSSCRRPSRCSVVVRREPRAAAPARAARRSGGSARAGWCRSPSGGRPRSARQARRPAPRRGGPSRCRGCARTRCGRSARSGRGGPGRGSSSAGSLRGDPRARAAGSRTSKVVPRPSSLVDRDLAAVVLGDVAHDRQAEPGAAGLARARLVDPVEAFEDPGQVALRDARSPVSATRSRTPPSFGRDSHVHVTPRRRVPDRVVDQVADQQREVARGARAREAPARSAAAERPPCSAAMSSSRSTSSAARASRRTCRPSRCPSRAVTDRGGPR